MSLLRILVLLGVLIPVPAAAVQAEARTDHLEARLLADHESVRPGDRIWVGLRFDLIPHWHVYWRNPGDSGSAPRVRWRLPDGWEAGELHWPVPERIPVGPLVNYGYEGSVTLMTPLRVGPIEAGETARVEADARWLVCREECIPEEAVLAVELRGASGPADGNPAAAAHFDEVRERWPRALDVPVHYRREGDSLRMSLGGGDWRARDLRDLWLASHEWGPLSPSGGQSWRLTGDGLHIRASVGDLPPRGTRPFDALLVVEEGTAGSDPRIRGFTLEARPGPVSAGRAPGPGLWAALGLALLGGLLLNLMPCVLPVLSVKVMGFVHEARNSRRRLALHGSAFTVGVLTTMLVLAAVLIVLRAGGHSLGWGFQLQSPVVVSLLAYLMLAVGLSLSGVLRLGGGLMGLGQGVAGRRGAAGAFWTGALAVVVASPCTAPFMGAALGFALTRPAGESLAVFLALGAGLALPLLVLSLWPAWTRLLPRPGPWMDRLQQLLAFPMYGAAAWLVWVLSQQTGPQGLAAGLAGLVTLGLGAWLLGQRQAMPRTATGLGGLALAGALALAAASGPPRADAEDPAQGWTLERVEALRAAGRPVLVNFTAAWCITCQVNERLALSRPSVRRAMRERNVAYLKADWTRRDPEITRELERFGRSGVPLYLLFPPGADAPRVLPQVLTEGRMLEAFEHL